jgi:hypothetical protein
MGDPIPAQEPEPIPLPHEPPTQFRARTKYLRKEPPPDQLPDESPLPNPDEIPEPKHV